jgi:hypothetical protein
MTQQAQMKLASLVIVFVLGFQFIAVVLRSGVWIWPFTDYPMYASSHQEGERVSARHFIYATTADGEEIEISADDVGVNIFLFERWGRDLMDEPPGKTKAPGGLKGWLKSTAWFRLLKGEDQVDMAEIFLAMVERNLGVDIVRLRVEDTPYIVTRHGFAPATPEVVSVDVEALAN